MATLHPDEITRLLSPYLFPESRLPAELPIRLGLYLDLLVKWNARTNLTAIRNPEDMVRRHFGESLFAGQHLGPTPTMLDFGSGAGLPGIPIALLHPGIAVTLAESQNKKATFLREAVRTLGLDAEIWGARAETLPAGRRFHTVAMRAVDDMASALTVAQPLATHRLAILASTPPILEPDFVLEPPIPMPGSESTNLYLANRR